MIETLSTGEIAAFLAGSPDWVMAEDRSSISRSFKFADFRQAMVFMNETAAAAEAMNHHPDWCNSYNRVNVSLTTHSAKTLTARDIELARSMDGIADRILSHDS